MKQGSLFAEPTESKPYPNMRQPCPACGHLDGTIAPCGHHMIVRCAACDAYVYFAPRSEYEPRGA